MDCRQRKYLDLSGYMFSGKHAVIDLLREFSGFHVPHFEYEFMLLRVQDGIADLEKALVDDWSPIRCPAAIRRFKRLTRMLGREKTKLRLGYNYDNIYGGQFTPLAEHYCERLIDLRWKCFWPFEWHDYGVAELFYKKLLQKLKFSKQLETDLYLASGDNFIEETRTFLSELLSTGVPENIHTVVMHNAIEPFNTARGLNYFDKAQIIIVDRDPRDNYIASVTHSPLFRKISAAHSVDTFIQRYRLLRSQSKKYQDDPLRVLRLPYEKLVYDYDTTVEQICDFLGVSRSDQVMPRKYFDPKVSSRYVGMWRDFPRQDEIKKIEAELDRYCVNCF